MMDAFTHNGATLFAEDVDINTIAEQFGTPAYIYSRTIIERNIDAYRRPKCCHNGSYTGGIVR